jgi:hypothetical protein
MKKINTLIVAAVAATLTGAATADIAISGAAKFNATDGVYTHEADLKISGKSGDTSVTVNVSLDDGADNMGIVLEDTYLTTAVAGVKVKMGAWRSGKSELGVTSAPAERVNVSTTFGGLSLAYEDKGATNSTTIGGSLAGVSISHKINQDTSTETKASGTMGGVSIAAHSKESAASATNTAVTLSTEVQGVTLTYLTVSNDSTISTDGFMSKQTIAAGADASAFGIATSIAGNSVKFKAITVGTVDTNKVIVTRALGAGATIEATYSDKDGSDATLDLELAVKF